MPEDPVRSGPPITPSERGITALIAFAVGASGPMIAALRSGDGGAALALALAGAAVALAVAWAPRPLWRAAPAVLAAAGIAVWLTAGRVDRTAVALTVAGVIVGSSVRGAPRPAHTAAAATQAGSVRPSVMMPLVAAQFVSARNGPGVVAILLVAGAALVSEAHAAAPAATARLDRGINRMIRTVAEAVSTALIFAVSLLLLYLPGSLMGLWSRARRPVVRSTWRDAPTTSQSFRQRSLPFRSDPTRARRVGVVAGLTVALVAAVLVGRGLDPDRPTSADTASSAFSAQPFSSDTASIGSLPAFAQAPWADELEEEQRKYGAEHLVPSPIGGFITGDYAGRFTNVVDGERVTTLPTCTCPSAEVWILGGSAAFGIGQRDEHTVASELVRLASAEGIGLEVRNLGVPGWTLWQEYIRTSALLAAGERPDLIIFYDGFNDVVGTVVGGTLHGLDDTSPSSLVSSEVSEFVLSRRSPAEVASGAEFGEAAADRYRMVKSLIDTLAADAGVPTVHFFQPDALADPDQLAGTRDMLRDGHPDVLPVVTEALDTAASALEGDVVDLRQVFDDLPDPVFADLVHTNEAGAAAVAGAVLDTIRAQLERVTARG